MFQTRCKCFKCIFNVSNTLLMFKNTFIKFKARFKCFKHVANVSNAF